MKLLITGGAGFIGSNFIRYLIQKYGDYSIVNFDKLTYAGKRENLADVEEAYGDRYRFVHGDIARRGDLEPHLDGIDVIINFAAESHVDRSILAADTFVKTDVYGTYTILELVKEKGIQKFIQISTDEVFGEIVEGEFTEVSPFLPNSPYSASKASADLFCRAYAATYNAPVIVTHSCNVYGPYQYPEKIIPLFITNVLEQKKVPVYGHGKQVREWIFTEDYSRALDTLLHHGVVGDVYNIGSGYRLQNVELTHKILGLLSQSREMIEYVKDRPGHDARYAVNADKLKKLGWKPEVALDQGLEKTVDWYRNNEAWWKPLKSGEYLEYYKKQYLER